MENVENVENMENIAPSSHPVGRVWTVSTTPYADQYSAMGKDQWMPYGMENADGSQCYFNVVIQLLLCCQQLRIRLAGRLRNASVFEAVCSADVENTETCPTDSSPLLHALYDLICARHICATHVERKRARLLQLICHKWPTEYAPRTQSDAHELWDRLLEEVEPISNESIDNRDTTLGLATGILHSSTRCTEPKCTTRTRTETSSFRSLHVYCGGAEKTVGEMVSKRLETEQFQRDACPTCQCCTAIRTHHILANCSPEMLVLNVITSSQSCTVPLSEHLALPGGNRAYRLAGVIEYHDSSRSSGARGTSGHYTCYCRYGDRWFRCDDVLVEEVEILPTVARACSLVYVTW